MTRQCHEVQTVETALGRGNSWSECPRQDGAQRAQGTETGGSDAAGQVLGAARSRRELRGRSKAASSQAL